MAQRLIEKTKRNKQFRSLTLELPKIDTVDSDKFPSKRITKKVYVPYSADFLKNQLHLILPDKELKSTLFEEFYHSGIGMIHIQQPDPGIFRGHVS